MKGGVGRGENTFCCALPQRILNLALAFRGLSACIPHQLVRKSKEENPKEFFGGGKIDKSAENATFSAKTANVFGQNGATYGEKSAARRPGTGAACRVMVRSACRVLSGFADKACGLCGSRRKGRVSSRRRRQCHAVAVPFFCQVSGAGGARIASRARTSRRSSVWCPLRP